MTGDTYGHPPRIGLQTASYIHSRATFAQSSERRVRRWLENPAIDPTSIYGSLVTRALRDWGDQTLILALDTSVLFEKFCLIRISVLFRGRAVPLVSRVLEHSSAQVSTTHLLPVLAEVKGLLDFVGIQQVRLLADRGFCDTDLMARPSVLRMALPHPDQVQPDPGGPRWSAAVQGA